MTWPRYRAKLTLAGYVYDGPASYRHKTTGRVIKPYTFQKQRDGTTPEREIKYLPARHDPDSCGPLNAGFDGRSCLLVLIVIAVVLGAMAAGVVMR
jgi:hypothetical protein